MRMVPLFAVAGALLAGCSTAPPQQGETYFVRDGMVTGIDPSANAIWNLQVEAMDDYGNFDPALMTADKWAALEEAARRLEAEAIRSSSADSFIVANPNGGLGDPPLGTDLPAIQQRLDEHPASYAVMSKALAQHAGRIVEAAKARDAAAVTALANDMQPVCKACHDTFWYPEEYQ